jgi:chromate transport protein ChrA
MTTKNLNFMSLIQDDRTEEQHSTITIVQMAKEVWPMGFISYGGPMAHIGLFRERFITNLKWY